jgi:hypothetical protein
MSVASTKQGDSIVMVEQPTKRFGALSKHLGGSLKGFNQAVMEEHGQAGASGDYTVTITGGKQIPIRGAIAIRVLDHGELNLVTDTGRWYLFAPDSWESAVPTQPTPGNSTNE